MCSLGAWQQPEAAAGPLTPAWPAARRPPLPQDSKINLWWADNGVRAGSFDGHNGVVWTVDLTCERRGP